MPESAETRLAASPKERKKATAAHEGDCRDTANPCLTVEQTGRAEKRLVEVRGLEPLTYGLQSHRSPI